MRRRQAYRLRSKLFGLLLAGLFMNGCAAQNGAQTLISYPELAAGSQAPDFEIARNDGAAFRLSDHEGEVVLLNFWATWCGPCINELPAFERLYEEYGDKIQILAIDSSDDAETMEKFLEKTDFSFPVACDADQSVSKKYPSEGIPYTVLIGKDGLVAETFTGARSAEEQYQLYRAALIEAYEK